MADLAEVADELYALLPADFTAARNARAKELRGEDRRLSDSVAKLPKPSVSAWAANLLVRRKGAEMQQVLDLGAQLRAAQEHLDPAALRELTGQRRKLVAALAREAVALGEQLGQRVGGPAVEELEQTLSAAMIDPWAATAVLSGRLVRPLQSIGLEKVDLGGAVAGPPPDGSPPRRPAETEDADGAGRDAPAEPAEPAAPPTGTRTAAVKQEREEREDRERQERRRREAAEARAAVSAAEAEVAEAREQLEEAERERTAAAERRSALRERQRALDDELAEVERAIASAGRAITAAGAERDDAADRVDRAESRLAHARSRARDLTT